MPEPLEFDYDERKTIGDMVYAKYESYVDARNEWNEDHLTYDLMYRGKVAEFRPREGPWPNAANLHVQAPYWLCQALNARFMVSVWNQNPQVVGEWEEKDDQETAVRAARLCEWDLQPKRMNARELWGRSSMIRLVHGFSGIYVSYVHDKYRYPSIITTDEQEPVIIDGIVQTDDSTGRPVMQPKGEERVYIEGTRYQGPTMYPLEWDDIIAPIGCMNLQPNSGKNPGGANDVILRMWEHLSLMEDKFDDDIYPYLFEEKGRDLDFWETNYPSQEKSEAHPTNNERERAQDRMDGMNRTYAEQYNREGMVNPIFEMLTYFGPWMIQDDVTGEERREECVFFVERHNRVYVGGYRLSDVIWTGRRPLVELHYQPVSNRLYSMGVCEIVEHLSEELDTLHNMRLDVGQATNLPWYFYKSTSSHNPDEVQLRPMKGVPIDDASSITFPRFQNVTAFYEKEEMLLMSLIERVFGITDLFLGISPTTGGAARHATGFLGVQQEGAARMSEIIDGDARAFSMLCNIIYDLEYQYGPDSRQFRLFGEGDNEMEFSRDELWFKRTYDFRLGANQGQMSQQFKAQQAQAVMAQAMQSPLTQQDPGRIWEAEARYYRSIDLSNQELEGLIGPKDAVAGASPKSQDEENADMTQGLYGPGVPSPVHPSDNDMEHLTDIREHRQSPIFEEIYSDNYALALSKHETAHREQMARKQQQQQMMQAGFTQTPEGPAPGGGSGASPEARAAGQLQPGGASPSAGATYQTQTAGSNGQGGGPPGFLTQGRQRKRRLLRRNEPAW